MRSTRLFAALLIIGSGACQRGADSDRKTPPAGEAARPPRRDMAQIDVRVAHGELAPLPPTATLTVTIEEAPTKFANSIWSGSEADKWRSRGLIKTIVERTIRLTGAPPHSVRLIYDPAGLRAQSSFGIRARIEIENETLFANAATKRLSASEDTERSFIVLDSATEILLERVAPTGE